MTTVRVTVRPPEEDPPVRAVVTVKPTTAEADEIAYYSREQVEKRRAEDLKQWESTGAELARSQDASQFQLGDWLNDGSNFIANEKSRYRRAVELTHLTRPHLYNLAYVADRVPSHYRNENLGWHHHRTVAAMAPERQKELLANAAKVNMTVADLRKIVNSENGIAPKARKPKGAIELKAGSLILWDGRVYELTDAIHESQKSQTEARARRKAGRQEFRHISLCVITREADLSPEEKRRMGPDWQTLDETAETEKADARARLINRVATAVDVDFPDNLSPGLKAEMTAARAKFRGNLQ